MTAILTDLTLTRARSETLTVTVGNLSSAGLAAFADIRLTAKRDATDADALAVLSKSLGAGGISVTTEGDATTNGVLSIAIAPSDTLALPLYSVTLVYDVVVYDANGIDSWPVASGTITVTPNVTQATS